MRVTPLGHACWLFEHGDVRLVTDPVVSEAYHDGVFEIFPRRRIDLDALAPTHVAVTHRHPDHFDPASLAALARRFPHATVLTSDALVVEACEALGFRDVRRIAEREGVSLGDLRVYTTPSLCGVEEWGVLVTAGGRSVWNVVDSALRSPDDVRRMLAEAADALEMPELADGPDVALVRWCPLLQAQGATSGAIGFPFAGYRAELVNAAATGARLLIPGSCGDRYVGPAAWQNASVYPVTEARFCRDLRRLRPDAVVRSAPLGVPFDPEGTEYPAVPWLAVLPSEDDRIFAPFTLPPITDPAPPDFDDQAALAKIAIWVGDVLVPSLEAWVVRHPIDTDLAFVLEIVFPRRTVALTLRVSEGTADVEVGTDPDHDGLDRIAGSVMLDVLEGRSHWGRALLGGWMRSVRRAAHVGAEGSVTPYRFPVFLPYVGLSYDAATERWVRAELERLGAR